VDQHYDAEWDAGEMGCGELVLLLAGRLRAMRAGEVLKLTALDEGAPEDIPAWCRMTGHNLVSTNHPEYFIRRREEKK
jgi:tRNA 2-thiouridine synthesizing protein A